MHANIFDASIISLACQIFDNAFNVTLEHQQSRQEQLSLLALLFQQSAKRAEELIEGRKFFDIFCKHFAMHVGLHWPPSSLGAAKLRISQVITDKSRGQWR